MHLEDFNEGALFSNLTKGPYPLIITIIMLALNSIFYVLLAVYLDQVIPGKQLVTGFYFKAFVFFCLHRVSLILIIFSSQNTPSHIHFSSISFNFK